jgi:hypothetical protein
MKHAAACLSTGEDPRSKQPVDLVLKEALFCIIGLVRDSVIDISSIADNMEYLLEKYVIPEFTNKIGFLRARACWLFGIYGDLEYKNKDIVIAAVEGIYKCLLDSQLPVQVKAGIALNQLLH